MASTDQTQGAGPSRISRRFSKAGAAEDRLLLELSRKYRILAQLGEGGTARVWLAMARGPRGFNKLVVLKTVRGELFDNASVVEMFLEEARLAARLNHPNIVQTNEVFEQSQHPVIVMEYLDGLPFSAILERQREGSALALAMLLRIISDALSGLHAAHELQDYDGTPLCVVHRDISPHNLFVTFAGQAKVLDFGIAQFSSSGETTESGVIKGKLRYIAPEQLQGDGPVDRRADIYSMGVVLWEIATAQRMWSNVPESTILKRILAGDLPRARDVEPTVDEELQTIINRALSLDPDERHETALSFQTDLDHYLSTLGGALRNRDIGRALSKMFDDVRDERRQTIERQLARSDTLHDIQLAETPLPELTSFSNVQGGRSLGAYSFRPGPKLLVLLALLTMTLFAVVVLWPPGERPAASERTTARSTTSDASPALPTRAPPTLAIRITAHPQTATITLDGALLPSNPYSIAVRRDPGVPHLLVATAPGHQPERRSFVFSQDQELVVNLRALQEPKPAEVAQQAPLRPAPRRSAAPPPIPQTQPSEAIKPNCSTPFYYDERGIKKYRPECL